MTALLMAADEAAALERLHEESRADWSLLATPVRVLVPSRSLRDHLAARLVRRTGGDTRRPACGPEGEARGAVLRDERERGVEQGVPEAPVMVARARRRLATGGHRVLRYSMTARRSSSERASPKVCPPLPWLQ